VLFWIYIHYNRLNKKGNIVNRFDKWNSVDIEELAKIKKKEVDDKGDFLKSAYDNFLLYYQPLISWVNRLWRVVFLGGKRRKGMDKNFPSWMKEVLWEIRKDLKVLAE